MKIRDLKRIVEHLDDETDVVMTRGGFYYAISTADLVPAKSEGADPTLILNSAELVG